jgi:hypothetical protein
MDTTQNKFAREPELQAANADAIPVEVRDQILRAVAGISYGSVEITVHGAKVVQIESREKLRVGDTKLRG